MDYREQLLTNEWQLKRQEVFEHDNYTCQICFNKKTTLEVHHKKYINGRMAWQYKTSELVTLCHSCHEKYHREIRIIQMAKFLILNINNNGKNKNHKA